MAKENVGFYFRLKNTDETRNYYLLEIKHNDLMSEEHIKVGSDLNYFEHFLVFILAASGCVLISALASLVGVSVGIVSSTVGFFINCRI